MDFEGSADDEKKKTFLQRINNLSLAQRGFTAEMTVSARVDLLPGPYNALQSVLSQYKEGMERLHTTIEEIERSVTFS